MIQWLIFAALAAAAAAALVLPLLRRRGDGTARAAHDLAVYRAQLTELETDHARGLLGEAEREAARTEIERRMLAATTAEKPPPAKPRPLLLVALTVIAVPAASLALYAWLGNAGAPDVPFAARQAPAAMPGEIKTAIAGLAARLEQDPDDLDGWWLLGRSYAATERYDDAAAALAQAAALAPDDTDILAAYGEALVYAADGLITPAARRQFDAILERDPGHQAARFYRGSAQLQAGDAGAAFATWSALAGEAAPDTPWLPALVERLDAVAESLGVEAPDVTIAAAAPGPTAADREAAAAMTPDERATQIDAMVARLAARLADEPEDGDGWKRLGRAKQVLGDLAAARDAYQKAVALLPQDIEALSGLAGVMIEAAAGDALPQAALALYERMLAIDADAAEALWFLGLDAAGNGRAGEAREHWTRLLARMPPGSDEHKQLSERIAALDG